ncbi:hypothetical protein CFIICLFH_4890 [Methylobacterium goesingense]|uniref:XRE family transcriptional regulator n=1 Tax=Methylobacterium goesingense TaxID=243690 RepID=A0ABV2LBS1_9HYPH|nr:hypothetical protein CFIICLFH_4890 [Methylobacterium goesingense]
MRTPPRVRVPASSIPIGAAGHSVTANRLGTKPRQPEVSKTAANSEVDLSSVEAVRTLDDGPVPEASSAAMLYVDKRKSAERLRKARRAMGFSSGKAAAETHGWPVGTYTGDEGGRRPVPPERADRYGMAFSVPGKWILDEPIENEDSKAVLRAKRLDELSEADVPCEFVSPTVEAIARRGAGTRLSIARVAAGFRSVRVAASHLGLSASTCHAHENGRHNLVERAARLYGAAYVADLAWLMTGDFPQGGRGGSQPTGNASSTSTPSRAPSWWLRWP